MIERVHEHLLGELKQNTRTDTVFVLTAILLNLLVLGVNSVVGSIDGTTPVAETDLSAGEHILYVEVMDSDGWWQPAGSSTVTIDFSRPPQSEKPYDSSPWVWHLPSGVVDVRYQLDDTEHGRWAVTEQESSTAALQTSVMYILILVAVVLNLAVIFGLLKGRRMRMVLLDGLIRMYEDKQVEHYYDQSLLKAYTTRYHIFISVVVLLGVVAIVIPLLIRYL